MPKSFREKIEDLLFAGLKPRVAGDQNDPLYLTNRTWQKRARLWLLIALPCLLVVAGIGLAMSGVFKKRDVAAIELTRAEVAAKALPPEVLAKISVNVQRDLDIMELHVEHEGTTRVVGRLRNQTTKSFNHAELTFDLADAMGSRVGAVTAEVEHIAPGATMPFAVSIPQSSAMVAMVRDVQTQ
jgi:hypothetical protein